MSDGICTRMKGGKCAENYCDYWDDENQICSEALLVKRKVEILDRIAAYIDDIVTKIEKEKSIMDFIKDKNIVEVSKSRQ